MNERIQELIKKAGTDSSGKWISLFHAEKLAELIVKECASEILKWKSEPFPYDPEFGAKIIKDHFGIKE